MIVDPTIPQSQCTQKVGSKIFAKDGYRVKVGDILCHPYRGEYPVYRVDFWHCYILMEGKNASLGRGKIIKFPPVYYLRTFGRDLGGKPRTGWWIVQVKEERGCVKEA